MHLTNSHIPAPRRFNNPFYYEPHPLCLLAVEEVKKLLPQNPKEGKMFGVLVVRNAENEIGYLAAYSGQIVDTEYRYLDDHEFVPAVYDYLQPDGYFKTNEAEISAINHEIEIMENSDEYKRVYEEYETLKREAVSAIALKQEMMKRAKRVRDQKREMGTLSTEELQDMIRESQFMKAEVHRVKQKYAVILENAKMKIDSIRMHIFNLKQERKLKSDHLQNWLFAQFNMRQCGIPFISGMPIIIGFMASLCIHRRKLLPRIILDKICKTNSITDCNAVETSSYGTWSGLSIINMALSFFVSQLLGIFVSAILEISSILNTEYFISSIVIIPIVLYSIYGQIKVGKVCPLCIIILMCVLSEALIFVSLPPNSINLGLILVFGIIYIGILFLLQFYTYINITQQEQLNTMIQLLKLKRKKEIMLLESTKIEPINSPIWFGEENSSTCITTIISPGCKHCQKIIKELCLLVEKGDKFRWNVVLGKTKNQDSEEIEVWIQEYFRDKQLFLQNLQIWSNNNDKSLYSVPYSFVCDKNKSKIISDFDATIEKLKIKEIPRIIVNDRILSPIYTEKDLKYVIADMSE